MNTSSHRQETNFQRWFSTGKNLKKKLGGLTRLQNQSLFDIIEQEGMIPNYRARFCTRILKIEPFIEYMNSLPEGSIMYVGLRADEEGRLGLIQKDSKFEVRFPLREWGWGINEVWSYLDSKNVRIPERTDCGCCFFQRLPEWAKLLREHPERYESYVQLEKRMGHTFRSPGRDTWPASLEDLRTQILAGRKMRNTKARGEQKCRFCSM